jgi:Zn-dependent protease
MFFYLFSNPLMFIFYLIALILAITIHEFSHAFLADFLGDPTPRLQKRLTLNPKAHLDPFGLLFLFFLGFGWGRPVEFDPFNLKNPRRDAAIISLAGPISNLILALILSILLKLFIFFKIKTLYTIGSLFFVPMIYINVVLAVFNFLPVHPLDGFKIVGGILPEKQAKEWYELEKYGLIFLLMMFFPLGKSSMIDFLIRPAVGFLINLLLPFPSGII